MERVDVCVVGAGLAGLRASERLARRGLRVLLVDRKPSLETAIQTTGIFVRRSLEDFDLPAEHLGPPVGRVTLYSPALRALFLESPRDEFRVGRMAGIYRSFLERCLASGVCWRPDTRYVLAEPSGTHSRVELQTNGRSWSVRTRILVGADGALSPVSRDLGLGRNREFIVGVEEVRRGGASLGPPALHCFLDPILAPGYLAWLAYDGEEVHLGVGGIPSRFRPAASLEEFRRKAGRVLDLSRWAVAERRGGRIPVGGILRRIGNARGLLVGDAAGAVSPLTAGGLDAALRLSDLAAEAVARTFSTADPTEPALCRGSSFARMFQLRRTMRRFFSHVESPALVEAGCALVRTPPLTRFARHVFFGRGSFPDVGRVWRDYALVGAAGGSTR